MFLSEPFGTCPRAHFLRLIRKLGKNLQKTPQLFFWSNTDGSALVGSTFTNSGIDYEVDRDVQEPTLLARAKLCSQIPRQCKRIRPACRGFGSKARRIKLVKCLIAPKIKWASYWRVLPDQWIYRFGLDIERCIRGPVWGERSPALAWILDLGHGPPRIPLRLQCFDGLD